MSSAKPINLFRTGTFTSVEGTVVSFGAAELQAIADAYDAASDPAPLVIGHPKMNDPAYGWVESLSVQGDVLVAMTNRVEPSFAETVNEGRYAKVSAQFYPPDHPNNPKPGANYLKHIGFLGAAAPAVKGLGVVSLADGNDAPLITITTNQEKPVPDPKPNEVSFAEREAALVTREAAATKREEDAAKTLRDARHTDHVSFAETMVEGGKLGAAGKTILVGILDELGERPDVVSFGEADADKMTPVAALKKLLGGAKPLVSLGEHAPADKNAGEIDPVELAREAASFAEAEAKAGRPTTVAQAVRHIQKKGA